MNRVLIIGLDGATFDLIRPWVAEGALPSIGRLMAEGSHGPLLSTFPPMTFPAWNTFMTGRNPGKHGIFDFTERVPGSYEIRFTNARYRKCETLWMLLSEAGLRVGVVGVPSTWPPEPVNGVMISGFDAPQADAGAMHPPGLHEELLRTVGAYRITSNIIRDVDSGRLDEALRSILETAEQKARTARYLYGKEPWDCFMVLFGESDVVSHHFWRYMDPRSPFHEAAPPGIRDGVRRVYEALDRAVGGLVAMAHPGTTVMLVSDHGFGGTGNRVLHVNRQLESAGLLAFRHGLHRGLWLKGLQRGKVWAMRLLPTAVRRKLRYAAGPGLANKVETALRFGAMDWERTVAFSEETPYYPSVWINLRGREPRGAVSAEEYEAVRGRVLEALHAWRNPETGEPVVRKAWRREEVYSGPWVGKAPDILVDYALDGGYSYLSTSSAQSRNGASVERLDPEERGVSRFISRRSGSHRPEGILVLHGPAAAAGRTISGARIMDVTPTVLRILGVAVPEGVDGRVLEEALRGEVVAGAPARRGAADPEGPGEADTPGYTEEEEERIRARLSQWGYL